MKANSCSNNGVKYHLKKPVNIYLKITSKEIHVPKRLFPPILMLVYEIIHILSTVYTHIESRYKMRQ